MGKVSRVGVVWSANPNSVSGARRSIPFESLLPWFEVLGIEFRLHQEPARAAVAFDLPPTVVNVAPDLDELFFEIASLDLLISVDTGPVHVASSLGIPVWTAIPFNPDWRWYTERDGRSPWYPTLEIFRQIRSDDWRDPIERIGQRLRALVA